MGKMGKDYGSEYSYPADPTTLTHQALAQTRGRLVAWHGYAVSLLAVAEISHDVLKQRFDIAVDLKREETGFSRSRD